MEIKIYDLKLKNFKGIKELNINFEGRNANIYGRNASGKTTIFDAFKWLFFNKDSTERTKFEIKTLDENNEPLHHLEHEVEATLIIDGQDVNFRRVLQEKWTRKRGSEFEEYAGTDESSYWIDEVPVKLNEYEKRINEIIPENLFKMITDPLYFNNKMNVEERRKTLISISKSEITDETILNTNEQFSIIKNNLAGRTIDDYSKVIAAKIKELNKDKEKIPIRIDELTNTLITEHNINYEDLQNEKNMCNEELQKIESEMTDIQTRLRENMQKVDTLTMAKNELNNLKFKLEVEHSNKYSSEIIELESEKSLEESRLRSKNQELEQIKLQIEKDEKRKEELYKKWDEVNNLKLGFDPNSFICPTCKREYEIDKKEEIKQQFENNFNTHKASEKQAINKEGQAINVRIDENTKIKERLQIEINELDSKLETLKNNIEIIKNKQASIEKFDVTTVAEYQEKSKEIEELQKEIDKIVNPDTTEIQDKKQKIKEQINDIDKKLARRDVEKETKERIEELEKEEIEISQKIQELESQQYQIEQFTKTKVELLENAINSNFKIVKFRLFEKQKNGGLKECCDALVNGVPYSDVNNAHKIIAGLDIINTLSKFRNQTAPIFIDNRESINKLCETNAQIISLVVTEDPKLRIEVI